MYWLRKAALVSGAAAVLAIPAAAQKKNKEELPEAAINAKYVYVEAYDGPEWDPQVSAEDRRAIADVERAVLNWGRYQLTVRRSEAEMVLQVRKGRTVEASAGGGVSVDQIPSRVGLPPSNKTGTGTNVAVGAEAGPPDDLLFVYVVGVDGQLNAKLWHKTLKDGLEGPGLKLFQKFKNDVNDATDAQAKKKAAARAKPADGNGSDPNPVPAATPNPQPQPAPIPPSH